MAGPFYIYRKGQWAEVDMESGRITGGGRAKFLYVSGGKLEVAKTKNILAGLRALAAGRPSTVRIGATLPARRSRSFKERRRRLYEPCMHAHCCNTGHHGCQSQSEQNKQKTEEIPINTNIEQNVEKHKKKLLSNNKPTISEQGFNENQVYSNNKQADAENTSHSESPCKELFIDYNDVAFIKNFAVNNPHYCGQVDSEQFEEDSDYRNNILFKFNPLVKILKSKEIDTLAINSQENMSLKEFAATLGLTHVDDKVSDNHSYKTRQKKVSIKSSYKQFFDERSEEKENIDFKQKRELFNKRERDRLKSRTVVSETDSSSDVLINSKDGAKSKNKTGQNKNTVLVNSSDDNDVFEKEVKRTFKTVRNKAGNGMTRGMLERKRQQYGRPIKIKMSAPREYSSLEDHAIISWLSIGDRSRRVNGNKLWTELQSQYRSLTSIDRSWHSLRNRYLRYILPSLGSLCLEPQHQAKLRADAAKGEIKLTRKKSLNTDRRNSMFRSEQVASAWARRPRGNPDSEGKDKQNDKINDKSVTDLRNGKSVARTQSDRKGDERALRRKDEEISPSIISRVSRRSNPTEQTSSEKKSRVSLDKRMAMNFKDLETGPSAPRRARSPPSYDTLTKEFVRARRKRLSTDTKSTPSPGVKDTSPEPKKRRLFNPRAVWSPITKSVEIVYN